MLDRETIDRYFEHKDELYDLYKQIEILRGRFRERITHFEGFTSKMVADMDGRPVTYYVKNAECHVVLGQDSWLGGISKPDSDRRIASHITIKECDNIGAG